ncbi:ATP-binding cassette domain-containing protein [Planosporangium mesophilum]|uniref:ABC transporter ATP-binding protein n=1 Tax=Planosporangium mesophilum TaxID=689768 RepID=A0A8J3TF51_9ACTN|nr:ATP-binding cassette domain-containing protein [Planosporangium mesophilum]NJC82888.1 ATP-binding cassette domain-containing protein [Planosporangium mesophilum]GII24662.1 ABC transporter ATP-binding protein [Planosporangium mesophilum]
MSANRLVCEELTKTYNNGFRLGPLSLDISAGVTCLVGANGAGKSTFFRLAATVDRPTSGTVRLESGDSRAALGYLPQEPTLPPAATCEEFLTYVAWLQKVPSAARKQAVTNALSRVGLAEQRTATVRSLSGGMRRRLGIAHAIVHDPALLLLDEPTVGLDPRQRIGLRETIANLGGDQVVIVSTHLVEDIRGLADRVVVLSEGTVVFDGDVAGLEQRATPDAPGDTDLERSIANLMGASA